MSVVRHPLFLLSLVLAGVAIFLLPAQYVPLLFRHDFRMISASLYLVAAGAAFVVSEVVRRTRRLPLIDAAMPVAVTAAVTALAVAYYRAAGGIGSPTSGALAGVAAVVGSIVVGVLLGQIQGLAGRVLSGVVALAVAASGVSIMGNAPPPERGGATECRTAGEVEYCHYPEYDAFVPYWRDTLEPVRAQVPAGRRAQMFLVTQRFDTAPSPGAFATPMSDWGRGKGEGIAELALALDASTWAVGYQRGVPCDSTGQARAIVAYWLAAQVSGEAADTMADLNQYADDLVGGTYAAPFVPDTNAALWAAPLLREPKEVVGRLVREHWDELVRSDARFEDAGRLLGLQRPSREFPPDDDPRGDLCR